MLAFFILLGITVYLLYKFWMSAYDYWQTRNFPVVPGSFPFGTNPSLVTLTENNGYTLLDLYDKMKEHSFFGIYVLRNPILVVKDPEIIRLVMTKEFSHFRDRQPFQRSAKEFLSFNLFNIDGERWRALRVKMSPTFTSGKLKGMFPLFVSCSEALDNLLLTKMEQVVNVKDIVSCFTSDTITSCAFGLEVNALTNPDSQFKKLAENIFEQRPSRQINSVLFNLMPFLTKLYLPRFTTEYTANFLLNMIKDTVEFRKKTGTKRNDFLDLLIQLHEKGTIGDDLKNEPDGNYATTFDMSLEMMTAQCFVFFSAGFETSGSVQSYCLYEMACNPDIQERVHEEIVTTIEKHGGLTYQAVMEMTYLEMVINETMRKYPTLPILTRCCTKPFTFPSGHKIDKGVKIWMPLHAIHHDPQYFPKPEVFDPERFSPENIGSIKPFTYMPFGEGPRICIGMRFAYIQTKMGVITLLRKYRVEKINKGELPSKYIQILSGLYLTNTAHINVKLIKRKDQ